MPYRIVLTDNIIVQRNRLRMKLYKYRVVVIFLFFFLTRRRSSDRFAAVSIVGATRLDYYNLIHSRTRDGSPRRIIRIHREQIILLKQLNFICCLIVLKNVGHSAGVES